MKSKLAEASRRDLGRRVVQMTAEERLAAYVRHCQAVIELDRRGLDLALLRRLAVRFGHDASRNIESLLGGAD